MRPSLAAAALALVAARAVVAQGLTIDWSRTAVPSGVVSPGEGPDGSAVLQLRATGPTSFHLVTIERPAVTGPAYSVTGQVRYESVEGQGYLEMWTVLPDGQRFFSRTLASQGTHAALHGESAWRAFELSFDLSGGSQVPSRLEINLVLPGRGAVWLGPLHLQQSAGPAGTVQGVWWSERSGALIGALLGSVAGIVGAIIGVLSGRGRARRLVLTLLVGMIAVGGCFALLGAAAAAIAQPRHVWYPLLVVGGASAVIGLVVLPAMRRRFAAEDAGSRS